MCDSSWESVVVCSQLDTTAVLFVMKEGSVYVFCLAAKINPPESQSCFSTMNSLTATLTSMVQL
jgi:hypothetical protein